MNLLAEMESLGIDFVSLRDNLDLTTPSGRLMFQIIGAMAEFERALIQERVKAGMRNAAPRAVGLGDRPRRHCLWSCARTLQTLMHMEQPACGP